MKPPGWMEERGGGGGDILGFGGGIQTSRAHVEGGPGSADTVMLGVTDGRKRENI